ncbi:TIR domain-containing protein [Pycnococcus provasolii]
MLSTRSRGVVHTITVRPAAAAVKTPSETLDETERLKAIEQFDFSAFKDTELKRRELAHQKSKDSKGSGGKAGAGAGGGFTALGNNDIFFSHCWRGKNEVLTKRKWDINELLSRPVELQGGGFTIWADYLDLQAKGPVAWRKEIEEGIRAAGKVVCVVDVPYLHSFNCLQEVAMAQQMGKPMVYVVLEKGTLDILTSADHGASKLWADTPPPEAATTQPLGAFAGANWGSADGSDPFDQAKLAKCLERVSNVNFCMCTEHDYASRGKEMIQQMVLDFVRADLPYMKEHARLLTLAQTPGKILHWQELRTANAWLIMADADHSEPPPTQEQRELIRRSRRARGRILALIGGSLLLLFIGNLVGMIYAVIQANRAEQAESRTYRALKEAEVARTKADEARDNATEAAELAKESEKRALESREIAEQAQQEAQKALAEAEKRLNTTVVALSRTTIKDTGLDFYTRLEWGQTTLRLFDEQSNPSADVYVAYGEIVDAFSAYKRGLILTTVSLSSDGLFKQEQQAHLKGQSSPSSDENIRHEASVTSCSYAPSGTMFATGDVGTVGVRIWNATSGNIIRVLKNHDDGVAALAWSSDSTRLISADSGDTSKIRVWSASTWELEATLDHAGVTTVVLAPDGMRIASGSATSGLIIWSAKTLTRELSISNFDLTSVSMNPPGGAGPSGDPADDSDVMEGSYALNIKSMAFSPNGARLALVDGQSSRVPVISVQTGKVELALDIRTPKSNTSVANSVSFSYDGSEIFIGAKSDASGDIYVFDALTGAGRPKYIVKGHTLGVTAIKFVENESFISASLDNSIRFWSWGGERWTLDMEGGDGILRGHSRGVTTMDVSPDGKTLVSADESGGVIMFALTQYNHQYNLRASDNSTVLPSTKAKDISWAPDGSAFAAGCDQAMTRIFSSTTGTTMRDFFHEDRSLEVLSVSWSADGKFIASAASKEGAGEVRVWSTSAEELVVVLTHTSSVRVVAFSPINSERIATGSSDKTVRIWSMQNGVAVEVQTLKEHVGIVSSLAWSPDGTRIASVCTVETQENYYKHDMDDTARPAGLGDIQMWNVLTGTSEAAISCGDGDSDGDETGGCARTPLSDVAWSPDGSMLAVSTPDRHVRIYDVTTRSVVYQHEAHNGKVRSVSWSPDSKRLATSGDDSVAVYFFDRVDGGELLARYRRIVNEEKELAKSYPVVSFSPTADVPLIVYSSNDGVLRTRPAPSLRGLDGLTVRITGVSVNVTAKYLELTSAENEKSSLENEEGGDDKS